MTKIVSRNEFSSRLKDLVEEVGWQETHVEGFG